MSIRVVELFAGVGGFRIGFERVSKQFETIWANQWEPGKKTQHAFNCYKTKFGDKNNCINEDIAKVKKEIPEHDLLCGGFPCQDYSVAAGNGAKGIEGKKGVLWWEIRDIVEAKHPKFIFLENVDRLLKSPASKRGRDFGIILRCLDDLGYCVEWRVINAADYGHPQKRRRTLIVAYNKDTKFYNKIKDNEPIQNMLKYGIMSRAFKLKGINEYKTTDISKSKYDSLVDITNNFTFEFEDCGFLNNGKVYTCHALPDYDGHVTTLGEILDTNVADEYFVRGEALDKWKYLKGPKKILRVKPNGEEYYFAEGGIPFPDNLNSPARTMLTSEASVNRSSHIILDPQKNEFRLLTPEECEKINEFPVGWTRDSMPHNFRYFVMGNALVVGLIESVAKIILKEI